MDKNFEQTVLAYLDGALDARSRHEFLREIARDPAKQQVLRQYRRLDEKLRDRSHPVAVPLRTQQALANHIPALQEILPDVPPSAGSGTGGAAGRTRFLTLPRGIALGIIAGLMLGGIAVIRMATGGNEIFTDEAAVTRTAPAPSASLSTASRANTSRTNVSGADAPLTAHSVQSARVAQAARDGQTARDGQAAGAGNEAAAEMTAEGVASDRGGDATPLPGILPVTFVLQNSGPAPLLSDPRTAAVDPGTLFAGRLHLYIESGTARFAGAGSADSRESSSGGVHVVGLRYDFSDVLAAGIELGQSRFARERLESSRSPLASGAGDVIVIDRVLHNEALPWLRLHARYGFDAAARLRFEADAGTGLLLGNENSLVFSSGLSAVYALSTSLRAQAGLHYSGTWLSPAMPQPLIVESGSGVIGIIRRATAAEENYNSAIEFRIGVGVLLW